MFIVVAAVNSCVSIPEENWMVSHRSPFREKNHATDCAAVGPELAGNISQEPSVQRIPDYGLDANGFSFMTWNIQKGKTDGWGEDFENMCRNTDIFILQEAYLNATLKRMLQRTQYQWDLSAAYEYRKIEAVC